MLTFGLDNFKFAIVSVHDNLSISEAMFAKKRAGLGERGVQIPELVHQHQVRSPGGYGKSAAPV